MIEFVCFLAGFACCLFLTVVYGENPAMRSLPSPITELSMEKSFLYAKLCKELDTCTNISTIRKFAKQALKISMINEMNVSNLVKGYANSDVQPVLMQKDHEEL